MGFPITLYVSFLTLSQNSYKSTLGINFHHIRSKVIKLCKSLFLFFCASNNIVQSCNQNEIRLMLIATHYTLIMNIFCALYALIYEFRHRKLPLPLSLSSRYEYHRKCRLGLGNSIPHDEMQNYCLVSICSISCSISNKTFHCSFFVSKNIYHLLDA